MAFSKALYFAALLPPTSIMEEVEKLKLEIKEKFGAAHALKLPAHITLLPPVWLESDLEKLFLERIEYVTQAQDFFPVELKDFGHFKQRVIFINVVNSPGIFPLYEKLRDNMPQFFPEKNSPLHPHITLATRDLTREKYQAAWTFLQDRSSKARFEATAITVFKHNGKSWDIFRTFNFDKKE